MSEGSDADYWFLRKNRISAKMALRMLAIAYKTDEREEEKAEEEFHNDFHQIGGGGERQ